MRLKIECFTETHAAHCKQAEQAIVRPRLELVGRNKTPGCFQQSTDFLFSVEIWLRSLCPEGQQTARRNLGCAISAGSVAGKPPHDSHSPSPCHRSLVL